MQTSIHSRAILFWLLAPGSWLLSADLYLIRPATGSTMELYVEKTGLLSGKKHHFTFAEYDGTLHYDPAKPEASQVTLSINSPSISCLDTWISAKDLKKVEQAALKDMLAAERYPKLTFVSSSIRKTAANDFEAQGMLTIRDIAKPATVLVTLDAADRQSVHLKGTSRVRLTDYGLKPPSAGLGTVGTKNEMQFNFVLTATRDQSAGEPQ